MADGLFLGCEVGGDIHMVPPDMGPSFPWIAFVLIAKSLVVLLSPGLSGKDAGYNSAADE